MRYMVFFTTVVLFRTKFASPLEKGFNEKELNYTCDVYTHLDEYDVHCFGKLLRDIPSNLNKTLNKLIVTDSEIRFITRNAFEPYRDRLRDVTLSNLPYLRNIEEGTFANIPNLRTIYISHAPQLKFLNGLLRDVISTSFKTLRITNTGLHEVPDLFHLPPENTMFLLDLDHNKIERLPSNSIKITAQQVTLNYNEMTSIDDFAFNGSRIATLDITGNKRLSKLGEKAFAGIKSLIKLDLSKTAIENLPTEGLGGLETLKVEDTATLQTIPSIYDLPNLRDAKLTHQFHCCAFKYPEQHNPTKHAAYEKMMKEFCKHTSKNIETSPEVKMSKKRRRAIDLDYSYYVPLNTKHNQELTNLSFTQPLMSHELHKAINQIPIREINDIPLEPLRGQTYEHQKGKKAEEEFEEDEDGYFHSSPTHINKTVVDNFCGNITFRTPEVNCWPEPNALNPCEDIMGFSWLRMSVWFVVILAVLGNMTVILVIILSGTEVNVSRFLICNLTFADFCMGMYLLLIACMDYHSVGTYFNFAFNWQYGVGCQIAGFLTVFASHLSIFTLTVITLERWFAITYAMHLTRRIRLGAAAKIMVGGWIYSILMGALPLFGISNYSSTSICLPMQAVTVIDQAYLYAIIIINGLAFAVIVFCYAQIYFSLGYETRRANTKGEMTIAKKMALLIFIDFATYSPIAFFGLSALIGYPLINVTRSKILLVFFYPLNACANPYLYALMTAQFRRDLCMIISRCGFCKHKAEKYRLSDSIPMTKPMPLLTNTNSISSNSSSKKHKAADIASV